MKRTKILSLLTALLVLTAAVFTLGCGQTDVLAAKVGDQEIALSTLENMFSSNSGYASYYGYDVTTAEGVEAFQDMLMKELVSNAAKAYQAELAGVTLTDEEEAQAKTAAEADYESFYNDILESAKNSGSTDVEAYANKLLTDTLLANGMNLKELKASYLDSQRSELLISKHKSQLLENIAPSEEEVQEMYSQELESQKALFDATPSSYFSYQSYYSYGYTAMPLYIPAGFFYVRHILVADLETAQEVQDKYLAGEDFETLLSAYNTDTAEPEEGYMVGQGASFEENFLNAALALTKQGQVSDIVESTEGYGYHIIMRMGDVPSGVIPYEEVEESFLSYANNKFTTEYYNQLVEEWISADYVEYYPENYRSVGKESVVEAAEATQAPDGEATAEPEPTADGE